MFAIYGLFETILDQSSELCDIACLGGFNYIDNLICRILYNYVAMDLFSVTSIVALFYTTFLVLVLTHYKLVIDLPRVMSRS